MRHHSHSSSGAHGRCRARLPAGGFDERQAELICALWAEYITGAEVQARLRAKGLPSPSAGNRLGRRDYTDFRISVIIAGLKTLPRAKHRAAKPRSPDQQQL
jgi:hypothetical protein